jgi:transketolase
MADNKKISKQVRRDIIEMSYRAKACHIGSALSCVDILVDLHFGIMQPRDLFLFTKASGVAAYYAVLAQKGVLKRADLAKWLAKYPLPSKEVPGVIHSVGSVGMGLSVAVGLALADRTRDVFVLISDGQLQEGVTYEAALFARQHELKNLWVYCDNNNIQACGFTNDIINVRTAVEFHEKTWPNFISRSTIKGEGVSFMECRVDWHYRNLDHDLYKKALKELK